ncbi:MAG: hypothetical protein AAGN35_23390 [Bacteroidota bacterium]
MSRPPIYLCPALRELITPLRAWQQWQNRVELAFFLTVERVVFVSIDLVKDGYPLGFELVAGVYKCELMLLEQDMAECDPPTRQWILTELQRPELPDIICQGIQVGKLDYSQSWRMAWWGVEAYLQLRFSDYLPFDWHTAECVYLL